MKKLIFILLFVSNILYSVPVPTDAHSQYVLNLFRQINALMSTDNYSQYEVDSLVNILSEYMHNQNYDSLGKLYDTIGLSGVRLSDRQFNKVLTEPVVKNYILPSGDTNSVLIVWKDGLPRSGIKFNVLYQNNPIIIDYIDTSISRADFICIPPPDFYDDVVKFRNVEEWQVKFIDICSGDVSIDEILPSSMNYFVDSLEIIDDFTYKVLEDGEPDKVIDISQIQSSLYFVVI